MPAPTPAERNAWRTTNADLIEWLAAPANQSSAFLRDVANSLNTYRSLTPRQTEAVRRAMGGTTPISFETGADDATHIHNGTFTINDGREHLTYKIHTVRQGTLQGKRIVKIQQQYGEFKGFAFLCSDGTIRVWRSFREQAARNEKFIVWARILVKALHNDGDGVDPDNLSMGVTYAEGSGYEIQGTTLCRRCNRTLTTPESISRGIGPECGDRETADRTQAANRHESVEVINGVVAGSVPVDDQGSGAASDRFYCATHRFGTNSVAAWRRHARTLRHDYVLSATENAPAIDVLADQVSASLDAADEADQIISMRRVPVPPLPGNEGGLRCPHSACAQTTRTYRNQDMLNRHTAIAHPSVNELLLPFPCGTVGCVESFSSVVERHEHRLTTHSSLYCGHMGCGHYATSAPALATHRASHRSRFARRPAPTTPVVAATPNMSEITPGWEQ